MSTLPSPLTSPTNTEPPRSEIMVSDVSHAETSARYRIISLGRIALVLIMVILTPVPSIP